MGIITWLLACTNVPPALSVESEPEAPLGASVTPGLAVPLAVPSPDPSADATGDTGEIPEIEVGTFGDCDPLPTDAPFVPGARLVGTYEPPNGAISASRVFRDIDAYAGFLADLGIVGNFVDFRTEHAAVFGYGGEGSCGFDLDGWAAVDLGGSSAVEVRVDDSSWGCNAACDDSPGRVWVVAFPRGANPRTCLRVGGGCGPVP